MIAVLAYLAGVIACAGLACGHPGQDLRTAARLIARTLRRSARPEWARGRTAARRTARQTRR